jgi:hypothetical protein
MDESLSAALPAPTPESSAQTTGDVQAGLAAQRQSVALTTQRAADGTGAHAPVAPVPCGATVIGDAAERCFARFAQVTAASH